MRIGVLALQGDYEAHRRVLEACGARVTTVRDGGALENLDGLVIPGGESTVMSRLCDRYELWAPLQAKIGAGMGVFGTCAGLIFMAHEISGASQNFAQKTLDILDIGVERNAYGAQLDSFESDVSVPLLGAAPLRGVFIRAPRITRLGIGIEVLAEYDGAPVIVRQNRHLAAAFHPEIAGDTRLHQLWLENLNP